MWGVVMERYIRTVPSPITMYDPELSFQHPESSPEQLLSRKMLSASPTFKMIGSYVSAKVCTVIFHQKCSSTSFEVTYAHNA